MQTQVEAWAHRLSFLAKIARRHTQSSYAGLGMSLQSEWQYLQRTVPRVGTLMAPIEGALRENFFPLLFGGEEITADFRTILGHSVKHGSVGIPDPRLSAEFTYNTSKGASRELVDSLLGGLFLNYVGHRACVHKAGQLARISKRIVKLSNLFKLQEQAGGQEKNRLHRATRNGAWFSSVPHCLNRTELSWEEFWDNLRLRYGLMPQDIPATCEGCGKKFSIEHALSCPKEGLVLPRHNNSAKDWVALGSRAPVSSTITYEPKINSRTVQGERTRAGARQEGGESDGGTDTVGRKVNRVAILVGQPGQVLVPAESRADVSAHGFWKRGTTAMFDIRIVNLDAGSYLRMTS